MSTVLCAVNDRGQTAGLSNIQEFVDDTKRLKIPVDFVSTHSYPSDGYCSNTPDPDCFAKTLLKTRTIAQKGGLPFMITEYKDGLQVKLFFIMR